MKSRGRNEISTLIAPTPVWTGQNPCASLFGRYKANQYGSLFFLVFSAQRIKDVSPASADCLQSPRAGGRVAAITDSRALAENWHKTVGQGEPDLMKRSTFLGSALSVLLVFSAISYAQSFVQQQDPKAAQQTAQPVQSSSQHSSSLPLTSQPGAESAKQELRVAGPSAAEAVGPAGPAPLSSPVTEKAAVLSGPSKPLLLAEISAAAPQTYTATAYCLRGRTASGRYVSRGLIAADPAVLPLGTHVRVEAGSLSGEYLVADTGGAVRGRHIDIWTPTAREALLFGRRAVKLTVLSFGVRRSKSGSLRSRANAKPLTGESR